MLLEHSSLKLYEKVEILEHGLGYILVPKVPEMGATALEIPRVISEKGSTRELTRALPDMDRVVGKYLGISRLPLGARIQYYVRFGELRWWERPNNESVRILRILPPNYASTMQVILRVRSASELDSLPKDLIPGDIGGVVERVYGPGFAELHVICPIDSKALEVVDAMTSCRAKLVNATYTMSAGDRSLYNMWLKSPDFF